MSAFNRPRLITPPKEEEEIYPYRRVWRSIGIEVGILASFTILLFGFDFLGFEFPDSFRLPINLIIALSPALLWFVFSYWRERYAIEPREKLGTVFIISALVANAIGIPLANDVLQVDTWLPLESASTRIIGYTVTVGVINEILKYFVVRFSVFPDSYRVRLDAVAYAAAGAVGYVTILNLQFVLNNLSTPDATAGRVLATTTVGVLGSILVGYGLAETLLGRANSLFLPLTFTVSALLTGIAIPIRAGLINAPLGKSISATRPIFGIGFTIAYFVVFIVIFSFLFNTADKREKEAAQEQQGYQ